VFLGNFGVNIKMEIPYVIGRSCEVVRTGSDGLIYLVSDDLAIKVDRAKKDETPSSPDLRLEWLNQSVIYSAGFPTPRPYGIFPVSAFVGNEWETGENEIVDGRFGICHLALKR